MEITELVKKAHDNAKLKGFWNDWQYIYNLNDLEEEACLRNNAIGARLMLVVGEVAEAQEALRKKDDSNFREELADIVIRVLDISGGLGVDLEKEIINKMAKNSGRPYKHGKAF